MWCPLIVLNFPAGLCLYWTNILPFPTIAHGSVVFRHNKAFVSAGAEQTQHERIGASRYAARYNTGPLLMGRHLIGCSISPPAPQMCARARDMRERRRSEVRVRSPKTSTLASARPASLARRFYADRCSTDLLVWNNGRMPRRMHKKSVSKAAASEEARRTLRYVDF